MKKMTHDTLNHRLRDYYKSLQNELLNKYDKSAIVSSHPGEKGQAREIFLKEFLKKHIPSRFEITSGHIIDKDGIMSKQLDIIIYDKMYTPILFSEPNVRIIPTDTTVGIIEVKSTLTKTKFNQALDNLRSAKKLKRAAMNYQIVGGSGLFPGSSLGTGRTPLFCWIVAFRSDIQPDTIYSWHVDVFNAYKDEQENLISNLPLNGTYCLDKIGVFERFKHKISNDFTSIGLFRIGTNTNDQSEDVLFMLILDLQRRLNLTPPLWWDVSSWDLMKHYFFDPYEN